MEAKSAARPLDRSHVPLTVVLGPVAVVAVAAATQSVREDMGIANVALVLAMITVAAALSSFWAGLATSVAAAFALTYFHTEPVHSLRITSGDDLLAVTLLTLTGVGVSIATALRVRRSVVGHHADSASTAAQLLEASLATERPAIELWHRAIDAAGAQFANVDARVVSTTPVGLPLIARRRAGIDAGASEHLVTLPEGGAVVQFVDPRCAGHLVLAPRAGLGAIQLDRRIVLAFADQLEAALVPTAKGATPS